MFKYSVMKQRPSTLSSSNESRSLCRLSSSNDTESKSNNKTPLRTGKDEALAKIQVIYYETTNGIKNFKQLNLNTRWNAELYTSRKLHIYYSRKIYGWVQLWDQFLLRIIYETFLTW